MRTQLINLGMLLSCEKGYAWRTARVQIIPLKEEVENPNTICSGIEALACQDKWSMICPCLFRLSDGSRNTGQDATYPLED